MLSTRLLLLAAGSPSPSPTPSASPSPSPSAQSSPLDTLTGNTVTNKHLTADEIRACGDNARTWCLNVYDATGSRFLARLSEPILHIFHILIILIVTVALRIVAGRVIGRVVRSTSEGRVNEQLTRLGQTALIDTSPEGVARRAARARTVGSVLTSFTNVALGAIAFVLILGELGVNLAPILASAGIVGVAVAFGAQNVVRDFLSGIFIILEDQYGVGDVVSSGTVTGVVEAIGLRSTRLRDVTGTLWHIRNGDVSSVGNISQGAARIVLDVPLDHGTDVPTARDVMLREAQALAEDREWADSILEEPAVWGVESLSADGITMRLVLKAEPAVKDDVARALRERLVTAFRAAGVSLASHGDPTGPAIRRTPARRAPSGTTPGGRSGKG